MFAALGKEYRGGLPPPATLANHDPRDTSKNNNGFRFQHSQNGMYHLLHIQYGSTNFQYGFHLLKHSIRIHEHIQYGSTNLLSFVKSRKVKVASCCFPFTSNLESPSAKLFQCHSLPPRRHRVRMANLYVDLFESLGRAVSPSHCCVTGDPSNAFPTTGAPSNPVVGRSVPSLLLATAAAGATASRKHYRSELGAQGSNYVRDSVTAEKLCLRTSTKFCLQLQAQQKSQKTLRS
jgi:hypothetical protein